MAQPATVSLQTLDNPAPSLDNQPSLAGVAHRVTSEDAGKVAMPGTDRAVSVEVSLARAKQAAKAVGITRLADVTRLDRIGIPTWQAIRPASRTLTVSQGKGMTDSLAQVSALMESIEFWHAENPVLETFTDTIAGLRGELCYDPYALQREDNDLLHDALPLEWTMARRLGDGRPVPVPYRMAYLEFTDSASWRPRAFMETSNGLASGNTYIEATLHALYEVIERDAVSRAYRLEVAGDRFDPRTLGSAAVDELLGKFAAAEVAVDVRMMPSLAGLPCVSARIVSDDYQVLAGGYGAHLSVEIATTRALTEAAQSRLSLISGSRDDLIRRMYWPVLGMLPSPADLDTEFKPLPPRIAASRSHENLVADLADLERRCAAVYGTPLLIDLTRPDIGIPVVQVLVPGCDMNEGVA